METIGNPIDSLDIFIEFMQLNLRFVMASMTDTPTLVIPDGDPESILPGMAL
jgi:hypothetical protein